MSCAAKAFLFGRFTLFFLFEYARRRRSLARCLIAKINLSGCWPTYIAEVILDLSGGLVDLLALRYVDDLTATPATHRLHDFYCLIKPCKKEKRFESISRLGSGGKTCKAINFHVAFNKQLKVAWIF